MNQELYNKIDDYLNGNLKGESLIAFEQTLAQDDALAKEVEIFRLEKKGVEVLIQEDLRNKMQVWNVKSAVENLPITKGASYNNRFWKWSLGIFILVIAGCFLYLNKKKNVSQTPTIEKKEPLNNTPLKSIEPQAPIKTIEQRTINPNIVKENKKGLPSKTKERNDYLTIALDFYDNPDMSNEILKGESIKNDPLAPALEAWKNNDFKKVIEFTQIYPKGSPVYIRSQEILAHAYFRNNNYVEAEKVFSNIIDLDSGASGEDAEWYKLLCLIALKKTKDAYLLINKILNAFGHQKNLDAKNLMPIWVKLNTRKN